MASTVEKFCFLIGPEQFTIDCCPSEVNAITRIFNPTRTKIQFCVFHVTQAWNRHLASVSVPGNTPGENQIFVFLQMVAAFQLDYGDQSKFMDYFTRNWYTKDKMKVWSRSFKGRQYSHMLTNNYIESWHNQLKTVFLGRVRNKRLDKLVFVLVNDVEYYLNQEFERVVQGNGAMSPFFKQQRLRELEAEEVDEEARSDMMTGPITLENSGNCRYMVCSFVEGASVGYSIEVTEDNLIMSCTCYDFEKRHQPSATAFWSKEEAPYSQVKQIYDQTRAQSESESALLQGIEGDYNTKLVSNIMVGKRCTTFDKIFINIKRESIRDSNNVKFKYAQSEIDYIIKHVSGILQNIFSMDHRLSIDWDTTSLVVKESRQGYAAFRPDCIIITHKGVEVGTVEVKSLNACKTLINVDAFR
ncbi:hypothetical protein G6F43_001058 [Rhizopus delemar]|nr:hypothetical protein G6F43_001058 [Rhizopus delemar]